MKVIYHSHSSLNSIQKQTIVALLDRVDIHHDCCSNFKLNPSKGLHDKSYKSTFANEAHQGGRTKIVLKLDYQGKRAGDPSSILSDNLSLECAVLMF